MIDINNNNGVTTVTLNRPEKHNAFDDVMIQQLTHAFVDVDNDASTRVMVLAGAGKHFSAGADLSWMKRMADYSYEQNLDDALKLATMLNTLDNLSKPTIAKIQGAAFGGAVGLVSCCDLAIAVDDASFCLSEVRIGLIPSTISPYVINAIGQRAARRYFLTAERFDAPTAQQLGLVSEVSEPRHFEVTIDRLANALLSNSPQALHQAKVLIRDVAGAEITQALLEDTSARIARIRISEEGQEGLTAFLDKRAPDWLINHSQDNKGNA